MKINLIINTKKLTSNVLLLFILNKSNYEIDSHNLIINALLKKINILIKIFNYIYY